MRATRLWAPPLAAVLALTVTGRAWAEENEDLPAPRPTAPDERTGHPYLALQYGLQRLLGSAEVGRPHDTFLGWGSGPSLVLGIPVRRDVAIEAWGSYGSFTHNTDCLVGCQGTSFTAGLGASYHLVDGTPFDPWIAAGVGYRQTRLESPSFQATYSGVEALRLAIGSDYFLTPAFGLGFYGEFMAGRYLTRSPGTIVDGTGHSAFNFGLRLVLSPF